MSPWVDELGSSACGNVRFANLMRQLAPAALVLLAATTPPSRGWHQSASTAVEAFAATHAQPGMKVLDVGGRDVNGGARRFFESRGCKFVCLDITEDPSVDVVAPPGEPCTHARCSCLASSGRESSQAGRCGPARSPVR
eukprot:1109261-Prymnesium_polylepis.1